MVFFLLVSITETAPTTKASTHTQIHKVVVLNNHQPLDGFCSKIIALL